MEKLETSTTTRAYLGTWRWLCGCNENFSRIIFTPIRNRSNSRNRTYWTGRTSHCCIRRVRSTEWLRCWAKKSVIYENINRHFLILLVYISQNKRPPYPFRSSLEINCSGERGKSIEVFWGGKKYDITRVCGQTHHDTNRV